MTEIRNPSEVRSPELERQRSVRGLALGFAFAALSLLAAASSRAAFVYETPAEFLTSADFNGDGIADVLVLDRATGNARVGYQSPGGALTWSAPLPTGVEGVTGCAIADFFQSGGNAVAVTSPTFNRVHYVSLANTNSAPAPTAVALTTVGPHSLVALPAALGQPPSQPPYLLAASSLNNEPAERLELLQWVGVSMTYSLANEVGPFDRGNTLDLNTNTAHFAVGLARGATNDALHIWQFTNTPSVIGALSNLPAMGDYTFGRFNNEALPRFWFYRAGGTNVSVRALETDGTSFTFGDPISINFTQTIERVYVVGNRVDGSAMIQFADGVQGVHLPGGVPNFAPKYSPATGKTFTGIAPLDDGKFVLLNATTGMVSSAGAQMMTFDGTNYTQVSATNLPSVTSRNSRANVWLFQQEPFVTAGANLIASLNAPDWSSGVTGLPGSVSARVETDAGPTAGLGTPATNNLASAAGANFGLPDQYRDDISFFTYASPRPSEPVVVNISPAPGSYGGPISISFTTLNGGHQVFYRTSASQAWQPYLAPFLLTNDATIQYYGRQPATGLKAQLQLATYVIGFSNVPPAPPVIDPNNTNTNPPPTVNTNIVIISPSGTIFYSRLPAPGSTTPGFSGPTPYVSFANSTFNVTNGDVYFYLETFEDGALNTLGATASPGWVVASPGTSTDSVDADDGGINGTGFGARSYYSSGQTNLTIVFNAGALGGKLPTQAGIVWTDVGVVTSGSTGFGNVLFSARDANGTSLGTFVATGLGDGTGFSLTSEDRFFGITHPGGISSISITMTNSGDWEVDHLQYGHVSAEGIAGTIWAINLDGSGERFITTGARPRLSPDGRWLAFLRDGGPVLSAGNLWVRDLVTGIESRIFNNTDSIQAADWNWPQMELVFDNACTLWRTTFAGPAQQLPLALTPECFNGAPVVNPVDGRLAFQNVSPNATAGVYVTPPNWASRTKLTEPGTLRLRWPAWSPDGTRLALADRVSSAFINTGVNLWIASADGSNLRQITALTEPDGFPRGAVWTHDGRALVGAGRIGGTNGLWVLPVNADGSACHCPPRLLPISPGTDVEFAGSVLGRPTSATYANLGLFIRLEPETLVVYWSTNYDGFTLQSAESLPAGFSWSLVTGPYFRAGPYYEHRRPRSELTQRTFYRLAYPGVLILTPTEPQLGFGFEGNEAVLTWPLNYVGYSVETATNLAPPVIWAPLPGPYLSTNGYFELRRSLSGRPQEFFRLRGP
jgi:hypothetical protein